MATSDVHPSLNVEYDITVGDSFKQHGRAADRTYHTLAYSFKPPIFTEPGLLQISRNGTGKSSLLMEMTSTEKEDSSVVLTGQYTTTGADAVLIFEGTQFRLEKLEGSGSNVKVPRRNKEEEGKPLLLGRTAASKRKAGVFAVGLKQPRLSSAVASNEIRRGKGKSPSVSGGGGPYSSSEESSSSNEDDAEAEERQALPSFDESSNDENTMIGTPGARIGDRGPGGMPTSHAAGLTSVFSESSSDDLSGSESDSESHSLSSSDGLSDG